MSIASVQNSSAEGGIVVPSDTLNASETHAAGYKNYQGLNVISRKNIPNDHKQTM